MTVVKIGTNISSLVAQRRLNESSTLLSKTFERLSSGLRINGAGDDSAGLALSMGLKADRIVYQQGIRNLNDGISLLNIADGALESLTSVAMRLQELAEQAANGSYSTTQRKALNAEAQALSKEYSRIARSTEFNGRALFTGQLGELGLQAGKGHHGTITSGLGGNIGTGTFSVAGSYSIGVNPFDVRVGDMNGDGIADIVDANYGSGSVTIRFGDGSGGFSQRSDFAIDGYAQGLAIGDFNGDGLKDFVVAEYDGGYLSYFIGTGSGSFTAARTVSASGELFELSTADINGDGRDDVITADASTQKLSTYFGQGNGTLSTRLSSSAAVIPTTIALGDFNGDGLIDAVTGSESIATNGLSVQLSRGDGTFTQHLSMTLASTVTSVAAGDVNGDGNLDIVATLGNSTLVTLLGIGNGNVQLTSTLSFGAFPSTVQLADFNGDGRLDVVGGDSNSVYVALGTGSGSFAQASTVTTSGTGFRGVATGDFNGDGVTDIASTAYSSASLSILVGNTTDGVAPILPFSLMTVSDARFSIAEFERKVQHLTAHRGEIGAFSSRVEKAVSVLHTITENLSAAESRIVDLDIAEESARLVRLQILQQAATAILAQANQQPSLVLTLL